MDWLVFLAGVAILCCLLALYWLWGGARYGKVAIAGILVVSGYAGYLAIYPPDGYYRVEFERITQAPFPSGGKILISDTTTSAYSSYRSCAIIAVSAEAFSALKQTAENRREENIEHESNICLTQFERHRGEPVAFTAQSWSASREGNFSQWGLLDDGQSVVYFTMRWKNFNPV